MSSKKLYLLPLLALGASDVLYFSRADGSDDGRGSITSLAAIVHAINAGEYAAVAHTHAYDDLTGAPVLGALALRDTINGNHWDGLDLAVGDGGTGASTPSVARTNLGVAIGSNVQAWSANLDEYATVNPSVVGLALIAAADVDAQRTALGLGTSSVLDEATAAEYRANTADKVLTTDEVWTAAGEVALVDGANIAVDLSAGINFGVTLGGNRTLDNPTNAKAGQSGVIWITQDGTGSRTLAYGANWKFAGGVDPTLSTTADAVDALFYQVRGGTFIYATLVKDLA